MQRALVGTPMPTTRPAMRRSRGSTAIRSSPVRAFFSQKEKSDEFVGFMYDPSMQRWIRNPKAKPDKSMMTVKPLSGGEYTVWPVMHTYLTTKKLKTINQEAALAAMKKGATLVDVRLAIDYEKEHAAGAVSVPLFRITAGNENWDKIKRVVMAGLNMKATERNPNFVKTMEETVKSKRKKVIVMCTIGGTLDTVVRVKSTGKKTETDKDRAFGRESRSLKACYELMRAGYSDVVHLEGGLSEWRYQGFPIADE